MSVGVARGIRLGVSIGIGVGVGVGVEVRETLGVGGGIESA